MVMLTRWRAIADRIKGVAEAGSLMAQMFHGDQNYYRVCNALGVECAAILTEIEAFARDFATVLSPAVQDRIAAFANERRSVFEAAANDAISARTAIVFITAFGAELSFLLSSHEEAIHSQAERAFAHLQRQIEADPQVRSTWHAAFESGEISCEKLGAAHLLWHGIYAFKADATGARTDLVFAEPPDAIEVARVAAGLVLTEWKVARTEHEGAAKFAEAKRQAQFYSQGPLSGLELAGYRYLVVVSAQHLASDAIPPDDRQCDVVFRHINIAVEPLTPSARARR